MKVIISSTGRDLDSNVSEVFGRCPYFIIVEVDDGKVTKNEILENNVAQQEGGAGISAAQLVAERGANVVIAKQIGPRAADVLKQFNIKVFLGSGVIKEVLQQFLDEEFK